MRKRNIIHEKYKGKCAYCGFDIDIKEMQVDHIIPKRLFEIRTFDFKMDALHNLNPACRVCNNWKGTWSVEEFRREIHLQIKRLNERSAGYRMAKKYGLVTETNNIVKFYFEKL